MKASIQGNDNAIKKLRMQISQLKESRSEADRTLNFRALDFQITQLTKKVTILQEQNELFRAENAKIKQHYKELYDSIKITRAKHIEQITALLTKNKNLKVQINEKMKCVTVDYVKPKVLSPVRFGNDHFGAIMGYGDYVIGDSVISRVYYVEGWKWISDKRTKNQAKTGKTEHGTEKRGKVKVNPDKSQRSKSRPKPKKC
ncbi:hypothetical protein Tco_1280158 [Tanacetum coccineum]